MTLSTSDTEKRTLKIAMIYLAAAILLAVSGAIYELFSHGVYSYYMIYAFMIPLAGGALPYLIVSMRTHASERTENALSDHATAYHAGLATLTIGSIMKGVLDIYGTTNRLLLVYPVVGAILIFAAVVLSIRQAKHSALT